MVNVWKGAPVSAPPSSFSYLHCVHLSHSIKPSSLADNTSFYLLLSPALFFPFFPHTSPLLTPANSPRPCLNLLTPPACLGLSWEPVPCHSYRWKWNKEQKKRTERCFWVHADTVWHTHTHTPHSDWNLQESGDKYWVEPNTSLRGFQPPSAAKEELIPSKQLFFPSPSQNLILFPVFQKHISISEPIPLLLCWLLQPIRPGNNCSESFSLTSLRYLSVKLVRARHFF